LRTCASYGDPAESVSTRMIVPPGAAASAAALTLVAVPSVSSVSPGPCFTVAGSVLPPEAVAFAVLVDVGLCAPAMCVPARIAPANSPPATRPTEARRLPREGLASLGVTSFPSMLVLLSAATLSPLRAHGLHRSSERRQMRL